MVNDDLALEPRNSILLHRIIRTGKFLLTDIPVDKMAAISQKVFTNVFLWMKSFVFCLQFHWSVSLRVQLTRIQHYFRWWFGAKYLNQSSLTHMCGTSWRWVECYENNNVYSLILVSRHSSHCLLSQTCSKTNPLRGRIPSYTVINYKNELLTALDIVYLADFVICISKGIIIIEISSICIFQLKTRHDLRSNLSSYFC